MPSLLGAEEGGVSLPERERVYLWQERERVHLWTEEYFFLDRFELYYFFRGILVIFRKSYEVAIHVPPSPHRRSSNSGASAAGLRTILFFPILKYTTPHPNRQLLGTVLFGRAEAGPNKYVD